MLTAFERAFFEAKISPLLVRLWTEKNIVPEGCPAYVRMLSGDLPFTKRKMVLMFCVAAVLMIVGVMLATTEVGFGFWTFVVFTLGLGSMVRGFSLKKELEYDRRYLSRHIVKRLNTVGGTRDITVLRPDKQFLRDAEELSATLGVCNVCLVGQDELVSMAEKHLQNLTQMVLDAENRGERDSWVHLEAGNAVKKAYGIFSRFGLTQDPLGEYYKRPTVLADPAYDLLRKNEEARACNVATAEVPDVKTVTRGE